MSNLNVKDLGAGALLAVIGTFFAVYAAYTLNMGTLLFMGPGFFPIMLGVIVAALGFLIIIFGLRSAPEEIGTVSWRGVAMVTAAVVVFAMTVRTLGLAPSLFISTMMASLSTNHNSFRQSIYISVAFTVFCIAIFVYAIGMPYDIIGRSIWPR